MGFLVAVVAFWVLYYVIVTSLCDMSHKNCRKNKPPRDKRGRFIQ